MPPKTKQYSAEEIAAIVEADRKVPMQAPGDHAGHGGSYVATEAGELTLDHRTRMPTLEEIEAAQAKDAPVASDAAPASTTDPDNTLAQPE